MSGYDIIDCHVHVVRVDMIRCLFSAMDESGVSKAAVLSVPFPGVGTWNAATLVSKAVAPNRLYAFCAIDYRDMNRSDFSQRAIARLEQCLDAGADGVKMLLGKPGNPIVYFPLTHPRMQPIYRWFAVKQVPVVLHIGDVPHFWERTAVDEFSTSVEATGIYADYSDVCPTQADIRKEVEKLVAQHPRVRFILAHLAMAADNLLWLASILDRSPALATDISASCTIGAMARQLAAAREFIETYADRVCFGSDKIFANSPHSERGQRTYSNLARAFREFLETDHEMHHLFAKPYRGIRLSERTLNKVYHETFMQIAGSPRPMQDVDALNNILDEAIDTMNSLDTVPGNESAFDDAFLGGLVARRAAFQARGSSDDCVFNKLRISEDFKTSHLKAFKKLKRQMQRRERREGGGSL